MNESHLYSKIAAELGLTATQVSRTIGLLDDDNTVPFIARYRKEMTGSLDEEQIRQTGERIRYLRHLEERKETVLRTISEQGKLTKELSQKIRDAELLQEVEDLYLPFRPKKRTRATIAREKGLEPLADLIISEEISEEDLIQRAEEFVDPEKGVLNPDEALKGAQDIIAEIIADKAEIRAKLRSLYHQKGGLRSEAADKILAEKTYPMYMDFSQPLKRVPPHRILAVNRGEKDGALYAWIDIDPSLMTEVITDILVKENGWILSHLLADACADAFKRLIDPSLQREMRRQLTDKADEHAIRVFARNLEALLMTPPVRGKVILGIDPGFRTGCKAAVIDATGSYLEGITIYPHPPQEKWEEAKEILNRLVQKHGVELAAIGNGTASRETEKLVAEIIAERCPDLRYTIVSEAGASVYSASAVAREEFPQLEASMRGNISIARRLMDPLAELVKIDPKSIGVGLYQHDVDQTKLADSLHDVVESCVNRVGVNLNTASFSLLTYVSGINSRTARSIATHREQKGPFTTRQELLTVSGLGDKAFQQCAGFLRIPESENLLDATAVHPESYGSTSKLLNHVNLSMDEVRRDGSILSDKLNKDGNLKDLAVVCDCGVETLKDIVEALKKPDRDPRQQMEPPLLRSDILDIDDLYEGLVLKGTVRNVVDFGAFVDVGLKQDGLVHLSNLAKRYVKDPLEVVSVGDIIEVKVIKVDRERGRISLSMVLED